MSIETAEQKMRRVLEFNRKPRERRRSKDKPCVSSQPTPAAPLDENFLARRGYFRIPVGGKSGTYDSLERCVGFAAIGSGLPPYRFAIAMTYFLQAIADELSRGQAVRIPGFGMFTPYLYDPGNRAAQVQSRFVSSRSLRRIVRDRCAPAWALAANVKADSYRRSHHLSSQPDRTMSSTAKAMDQLRAAICNDAGLLADFGPLDRPPVKRGRPRKIDQELEKLYCG